ncbi:hypothetical protein A2U01_0085794, partial [Trifolium medium]|nr:hypothetical protein [Trifolium medium]
MHKSGERRRKEDYGEIERTTAEDVGNGSGLSVFSDRSSSEQLQEYVPNFPDA